MVGLGFAVGVGDGFGVAVGVGDGVGVGDAVGAGVGEAVAFGVGDGVAVGSGLGVAVGVAVALDTAACATTNPYAGTGIVTWLEAGPATTWPPLPIVTRSELSLVSVIEEV